MKECSIFIIERDIFIHRKWNNKLFYGTFKKSTKIVGARRNFHFWFKICWPTVTVLTLLLTHGAKL